MVWASHFLLRKNSLLPTTLVLLTLVTILHYCKICKRPQATCFIRIFCNPKIFVADAFSKSSSPNCSANCLRLIDVCAPSPSRFLISRHSAPLPLLPTSDSSQMEWFHDTLGRMTAPSTRQRKAATSGSSERPCIQLSTSQTSPSGILINWFGALSMKSTCDFIVKTISGSSGIKNLFP